MNDPCTRFFSIWKNSCGRPCSQQLLLSFLDRPLCFHWLLVSSCWRVTNTNSEILTTLLNRVHKRCSNDNRADGAAHSNSNFVSLSYVNRLVWAWLSGKSVSHLQWNYREPKDNSLQTKYNCAQYKRISNADHNWSTAECEDKANFVCQISEWVSEWEWVNAWLLLLAILLFRFV